MLLWSVGGRDRWKLHWRFHAIICRGLVKIFSHLMGPQWFVRVNHEEFVGQSTYWVACKCPWEPFLFQTTFSFLVFASCDLLFLGLWGVWIPCQVLCLMLLQNWSRSLLKVACQERASQAASRWRSRSKAQKIYQRWRYIARWCKMWDHFDNLDTIERYLMILKIWGGVWQHSTASSVEQQVSRNTSIWPTGWLRKRLITKKTRTYALLEQIRRINHEEELSS